MVAVEVEATTCARIAPARMGPRASRATSAPGLVTGIGELTVEGLADTAVGLGGQPRECATVSAGIGRHLVTVDRARRMGTCVFPRSTIAVPSASIPVTIAARSLPGAARVVIPADAFATVSGVARADITRACREAEPGSSAGNADEARPCLVFAGVDASSPRATHDGAAPARGFESREARRGGGNRGCRHLSCS